jgi:hypothetical protein
VTRLRQVNTTDLLAAIRLGCRTMQSTFNADDNHVPFFGSTAWPYAALWFEPSLSEAHVPGRHLNALLTAEAVAGVALDPAALDHHRRAAFFSFSGPLCLPLNRQVIGGPLLNFTPTNLREGLHALYALVRFRADTQAQALAESFLTQVMALWNPESGWDEGRIRAHGLTFLPVQGPLNGEARLIGPLVKYYRATGSPRALALALQLKELCLARFFWPGGAYDQARFITDHAHSITSTLSSLAQLSELLNDEALLQRVKAFYDYGLWAMRDAIGWSPGAVFQRGDRGEAGNGGDIVETALILGRRGYPEYFHDAERILRCHLLPCQLRDVSFMRDAPNALGQDGLRAAADRHLGAFGLPAPYGHLAAGYGPESIAFHMDIVGSVVGSLCAAQAAAVETRLAGHAVNLFFDYDSPALHVDSPYTHPALSITLRQPGPLRVRLPPWLSPAEVVVEGVPVPPRHLAGGLFWAEPPVGSAIRLCFPLKESTLTLSAPHHSRPIRLRLRGDSPLAMDNLGTDLTYFEAYE